jgi:hypothetical protein
MANDHRRLNAELVQEVLLDDPRFLPQIVERVVQQMLEAEMTEHVGAAPHERTDARKGHRNGYKPRTLRTRVGTLNLLVPQDREGTFSTRLFSRYQRNEKALVLALMEMYVEGVSTRKVKDITEELCGTSFSKSLVSSLAGSLDAELRVWRNRRLEGMTYPYLFVDARYEKARVGHGVVSQGVLVVSAVRQDGFREILGVEVADTESEATYHELFRSLKARGLKGVELVVSDRPRGSESRRSSALPGSIVATLPGALREESPRDGRGQEAQGTRSGSTRSLRRARQTLRPRARLLRGREVARERPREGRLPSRRAHRGVPRLLGFSRISPPAHPHHQLSREVQPGAKEAYAGGEDLPQSGSVCAAGQRAGGRAIGRVADGQALPGHGGAARASALQRAPDEWGDAHGEIEGEFVLEEITETSGLDQARTLRR